MVIDKNTTQMHTFSKGMNTDTSDAYLEEGTYRLANNLRYITNQEENSGELHMIEGATLLTQIPGAKVLAATQLRETGVIVTSGAGIQNGGDWQVYTIDNTDLSKAPLLIIDVKNGSHDFEKRVIGKKLSLVTRWEDDDNTKLYIADGVGPIITIFLDPERYQDENKNYQVTGIEHLVAYPKTLFQPPKFAGLIYGNLKAGMYEYSYQYYIKHAQQSEISPSTKLIPLHNGALKVNDSNRIQGYEQDAKTNKGIKIEIPTNGDFNRLIIYRIRYAEVGVPPIIETVFDEDMPDGESFGFEDSGKDALNIISLEEYNMMTGIHIIPKTIESMTDYMFASNIQNDNPVYKYYNFKDPVSVTYEFLVADLIGDTNADDGCITIKDDGTFSKTVDVDIYNHAGVKTGSDSVNLDNFIGELTDTNNTYANPYVSYSLKSLRRGETYRYGIILYDKYHNATAVKHLDDIDVPTIEQIPSFSTKGDKLHVHPIGIRFNVNNLPADAVAYEIVRCGKDLTNMSTIMQCAISRPIHRLFDLDRADMDEPRPESTTTPLTPTGFVTNMDCWYGMSNATDQGYGGVPEIYETGGAEYAWTIESTWQAANFGLNAEGRHGKIQGNHRIFQIISPEYSYMSDTVKDMVQKNTLTVEPVQYISPYHTSSYNILNTYGNVVAESMTNVGNSYANVVIKTPERALKSENTKMLTMNTSWTVESYYEEGSEHNMSDVPFESDQKRQNPNRYGYIKMYNTNVLPDGKPSDIEITSTGFPDSLSWDDFATSVEAWQLKYVDKVTGIGGKSFCNWVCGGMYYAQKNQDSGGDDDIKKQFNNPELNDRYSAWGGMMGPGGKCFLAAVDSDYLSKTPSNVVMGTFLCNIKQAGGGYNGDAKYSIYRSYGNYFDKDTTNADVFDGDCFIQPFEYVSQHKWYHPYLSCCRNAMIAYSIPIETSINLAYTHGYELSKYKNASGDITNIQVNPSNVNNSFIQDKPLYAYNSVYSANSTSRTLAAEDSNNDDYFDSKFDYRVFNSMAKSNDETVDNWLKFLPANYIDVDTRYGEITGLRKFVNHLVFWQENAAGLLSVNERVQISDNENMPLTLGTADVLSRYDYMNTSNGMRKDEYADTQSDTTLYWWDHNKHEIIGYSGGTQTVSISKAKFAQNFLNEMDAKAKLIEKPLLWHDKQFNEVGFTVSDGDAEKKGTLMFGENVGGFTSLYSVLPTAAITFKDSTLLLNDNGSIYKWNSLDNDGVKGIENEAIYPYLKYVVNANSVYTKVFDNAEIAGRLYGGGDVRTYLNADPLNKLSFMFKTPLKQTGVITGDKIDNTEYNFRFAIPRDANAQYGGRLRGKTMQAELKSTSNSYDFSLQYIFTKYRISWT